MKFRFLTAQLIALALLLTAPIAWATSSTTISVASDQWYDLGAGPVAIQTLSAPMMYRVDDAQPSVSAPGVALTSPTIRDVNTSAHVWARTNSGSTTVLVVPLAVGGGGGGAITAADGALTTMGAEADAACVTDNGACTIEAVLKRLAQRITALIGATLAVTDSTTEANTGTIATNSGAVAANTGTTNTDLGAPGATACATDTGSCSLNALAQRIAQRVTSLIGATLNTIATSSGAVTNPTSTLTLPSATTAYTAGQLIASSATAGSITVPSFSIANAGGGAVIARLRLSTNDATSTAWGGQTIQVDLWSAAPTFANGDRGAWSPATGTAGHLGAFSCVMSAEYGDGAYGECAPAVGQAAMPKLASGAAIYWTLDAITGSGVTGAGKVFTLTAEELN